MDEAVVYGLEVGGIAEDVEDDGSEEGQYDGEDGVDGHVCGFGGLVSSTVEFVVAPLYCL